MKGYIGLRAVLIQLYLSRETKYKPSTRPSMVIIGLSAPARHTRLLTTLNLQVVALGFRVQPCLARARYLDSIESLYRTPFGPKPDS